jgi:hypothetical protein
MFLAVRFLPQEWLSTVTSEILDTKINHYCGVEGVRFWQKNKSLKYFVSVVQNKL